jgi:hypothetical protein
VRDSGCRAVAAKDAAKENTMSNDAAQAANGTPNSRRDTALEEAIEQIRRALQGLQFGEVSVIVQDGVVVQLERRERRRLRGVQR